MSAAAGEPCRPISLISLRNTLFSALWNGAGRAGNSMRRQADRNLCPTRMRVNRECEMSCCSAGEKASILGGITMCCLEIVMNLKSKRESKSQALKCVVYDALVLAGAIKRIKDNLPANRDLSFANDQIAMEMALIKSRSLIDFLSKKRGSSHPDDIVIEDFGAPPVKFNKKITRFRDSVNKYSAHLTWERVNRNNVQLPRRDSIILHGSTILKKAWTFIQKELSGIRLDMYGKRYYNKLEKIMISQIL